MTFSLFALSILRNKSLQNSCLFPSFNICYCHGCFMFEFRSIAAILHMSKFHVDDVISILCIVTCTLIQGFDWTWASYLLSSQRTSELYLGSVAFSLILELIKQMQFAMMLYRLNRMIMSSWCNMIVELTATYSFSSSVMNMYWLGYFSLAISNIFEYLYFFSIDISNCRLV